MTEALFVLTKPGEEHARFCGQDMPILPDLARLVAPSETGRSKPDRIDPCPIVTDDSMALTALLDDQFGHHPGWDYRLIERRRRNWLTDEEYQYAYVRSIHLPHRRTYPILDCYIFDPAAGLTVLDRFGGHSLDGMERFWTDLDGFAARWDLPRGPQQTTIGAALHRRDWYTGDRRVRRSVRELLEHVGRPVLGNFYRLCVPEMTHVRRAEELDLSSAHHHAAMRVDAPRPDELAAWGYVEDAPEDGADASAWPDRPVYARPGSSELKTVLRSEKGLMLAVIGASRAAAADPLRHPAAVQGLRYRWLTHIDLRFLQSQRGVRVVAIVGGISSDVIDDGLKEHGWWACERKQEASEARAEWLKPALLASYSILAAQTFPRAGGTRQPAGGGEWTPYLGPQGDNVFCHRLEQPGFEPHTRNIVWLALIHAWTRCEVLTQAQKLRDNGLRVLACYVDSVLLEAGEGLSEHIRPMWRHEQTLHNVTLPDEQNLISAELIRLPGLTGKERAIKEAEIRERQARPPIAQ